VEPERRNAKLEIQRLMRHLKPTRNEGLKCEVIDLEVMEKEQTEG